MKKLLASVVILISLTTTLAYGQKENVIKLNPPVNDVIVYLSGAQIRYKLNVNLTVGRNILMLENFSAKMNPSSIRITSDDATTVLSVKQKITSTPVEAEMLKYNQVNDSIKLITKKLSAAADETNALTVQKDMLLKNQSLGGQNTGVNVLDLQKAADFFQTRVLEINKRITELSTDSETYTTQLTKLQEKFYKLSFTNNNDRSEVSVLLIASKAQQSSIEISYVVSDAGWMPYYDLKCEDISKPLELNYRAKAFNNCGIDWNDVAVTLSTANPLKTITVPDLPTWHISDYSNFSNAVDLRNEYQYQVSNADANQSVSNESYSWEVTKAEDKQKGEYGGYVKKQTVQMKQISVPELAFDFQLKNKYTMPSDAQPYILDVQEIALKADYRYIAVPVIEKSAFLIACISDWEELNLVEGNANVYMNGTYVGQSYINPNEISDTLQISMGRDSRIQIDRNRLKDYSSKQLIGSKRKATYVYEISVKNNRTLPISIQIQDQLPVSNNQDIEVTADELSGAVHNLLSGQLDWSFTIDPGKVQTIKLGYNVKYPKNVKLQFRQMKAAYCPQF
ncbi:MAG: DUF4139 domain-containing protein [Bacteroidota bacterium]